MIKMVILGILVFVAYGALSHFLPMTNNIAFNLGSVGVRWSWVLLGGLGYYLHGKIK